MKILVSHEVPISLLSQSVAWNDFDYCLAHLYANRSQYPAYYEYYYNASNIYNREVLLDCSTFELKESFDAAKYKDIVEDLKPSCYIIPDVLEDGYATCNQHNNWLSKYGATGHAGKARKIGVVQGKTFQELVDCYKFLIMHVDEIAISFDYSYYLGIGLGKTNLERYCTGRQRFIIDLIHEGIWNWRIPVHLLGCSLAREFSFYVQHQIKNIRSVDTSNPIVAAMENKRYDNEFGLKTKSTIKLADNINLQFTDEQNDIRAYNVEQFKKILGR